MRTANMIQQCIFQKPHSGGPNPICTLRTLCSDALSHLLLDASNYIRHTLLFCFLFSYFVIRNPLHHHFTTWPGFRYAVDWNSLSSALAPRSCRPILLRNLSGLKLAWLRRIFHMIYSFCTSLWRSSTNRLESDPPRSISSSSPSKKGPTPRWGTCQSRSKIRSSSLSSLLFASYFCTWADLF